MSELTFNVGGRVLTALQIEAIAPKRKAAVRTDALKRVDTRSDAKQSDGFIVTGYSPDHWAQRIKDHELAKELFAKDPNKNKQPGSLDEFTTRWLTKNKPKRARTKPYEIESSADLCADLMRKAGWLHVRVDELLKG